jgi:deoxycytidylate deaminase
MILISKYGNQIRGFLSDNAALAVLSIARIMNKRHKMATGVPAFRKTAFLIDQFKRKEEVDLFRSLYGRLFFQISVYSRKGARVDYLSSMFASSENKIVDGLYRARAERLIQADEDEHDSDHGQQVSKIFHDADFIVNSDIGEFPVRRQVKRFVDLIFGSNSISPTRYEYEMYIAKAAALRTLDLSRQVGAAIFSNRGEIIAMGSNEVPRAGGGTYWSDDELDDREHCRGFDSNEKRKDELIGEIFSLLKLPHSEIDEKRKLVADSQFMDALEYGRVVHAEMSAITDAARLGRAVANAVLFSTTFPCHMCAKHIISSGISKVVFLEPYPKSLTGRLHGDAVSIEGGDRGRYKEFGSVEFLHFFGVSPRRYREIFERGKRKKDGQLQKWANGRKIPIVDIKYPFYAQMEQRAIEYIVSEYLKKLGMSKEDIESGD